MYGPAGCDLLCKHTQRDGTIKTQPLPVILQAEELQDLSLLCHFQEADNKGSGEGF